MYYENKREKTRKNIMAILFMVIIIALLASLNLRLQLINEKNLQENYEVSRLENIEEPKVSKTEYDFIEEASKAIVGISKLKTNENKLFASDIQTVGTGSGIIITEAGYILTNQHLVRK